MIDVAQLLKYVLLTTASFVLAPAILVTMRRKRTEICSAADQKEKYSEPGDRRDAPVKNITPLNRAPIADTNSIDNEHSNVQFYIAAVSYEGSLFGWRKTAEDRDIALHWGFHCCQGSLRAIAASSSGRYLVCGGSDERLHIFDMRTKRAIGELSKHTGVVTCVEFVGDEFMLSGAEVSYANSIILILILLFIAQDNTICIWRVRDWVCIHILGGHRSVINSIAVHPSGRIALSVSRDSTLRLWNLVEGMCVALLLFSRFLSIIVSSSGRNGFTRKLKTAASKVQ